MRIDQIILGLFLLSIPAGCAAHGGGSNDGRAFPFHLRGVNTRFRVSFSGHSAKDSKERPRPLDDLELCYLNAGRCTIECFPFGSLLMLGPDDAMPLVDDNALSDLRPDGRDPQAESLLDTIGVISVIGGSIERLPETLAEYIEDPDDNFDAAVSLAHQLLSSKETKLPGFEHNGGFTVAVQLTRVGRRRLLKALRTRRDRQTMMVKAQQKRPVK